jgi:hypothetical protein
MQSTELLASSCEVIGHFVEPSTSWTSNSNELYKITTLHLNLRLHSTLSARKSEMGVKGRPIRIVEGAFSRHEDTGNSNQSIWL